jgi:glycosyltransferase involved in cell wall biosynthesis
MRENGFDVTVIGAPGPELERVREREGVEVFAVPLAREIDARSDPAALANLVGLFRRLRPDIVNAGTPKAGLLGMLAARATRVPIRIYLLRGLRCETARGIMRPVLAATERIASACAHDVICVSRSLLRLAVEGGFIPESKASVLGEGSSNGYDTNRYHRAPELVERGRLLGETLGIAREAPIVGFVGRLARDKGILELLDAFEIVRRERPGVKLLLLGGDLADEVADRAIVERIRGVDDVTVTGRIDDLAPWYARIDVLVHPSYREGFPNVLAEAGCAEVPVVGFRSTGVVDVIADNVTGMLVPQGDVGGLARSVLQYLRSPELARSHGRAARARITSNWERSRVWNLWLDAYRSRLRERSLPLPGG